MLNFSNVSLRRGNRLLFQQACFSIPSGKKVGVTGGNGAGKSSLFALVLKSLEPDQGEFELPSGLVVAHVAQETPEVDRPALEYVMDGDRELRDLQRQLEAAHDRKDGIKQAQVHGRLDEIQGYSAKARAAKLMAGLGFGFHQQEWPVSRFSGGWRMRLNLAQALMCRSDLLLLDEPTNHLDLDAVIWLQDWLCNYRGTLLLISHDRDFLDYAVDSILHIEQQTVTLYSGNYSAFESLRSERLAQGQVQYKKQQREIAHIRQFVDRFRAQATKARQVQSRIKSLEKLELIAKAHADTPFNFRFHRPEQMPDSLLNLRGASVGYDHTEVLNHINLTLTPGDRIGLLGRNGTGKSTLIKLLADEQKHFAGERYVEKGCLIGYFAQHQLEQLDDTESALRHLQSLGPETPEKDLRNFLGGFGFSGDQTLQPVATFSGGEKSRLLLAMIVYQKPNLLLLDEPTNHLDLDMRHALCMALQDFEGAMMIVSHDRHLLRSVVDQFLLVAEGRVRRFDGDLENYRQWLSATRKPKEAEEETSKSLSGRDRRRVDADRRKQLGPLTSALKQAEQKVDELSSETERLGQLLSDPMLYENSEKDCLKQLLREKAHIDGDIENAEADWLSASEALETAERSL